MFLGKVPKASWPMKSRRVISIAKPVGSRKTGTNAAPVFPTIRKNKSSSYFFLKKTFSFAGSDESAPVRVRLPGPVGRLPAGHGEKRGPVRPAAGHAKGQVRMMRRIRPNVRRGKIQFASRWFGAEELHLLLDLLLQRRHLLGGKGDLAALFEEEYCGLRRVPLHGKASAFFCSINVLLQKNYRRSGRGKGMAAEVPAALRTGPLPVDQTGQGVPGSQGPRRGRSSIFNFRPTTSTAAGAEAEKTP